MSQNEEKLQASQKRLHEMMTAVNDDIISLGKKTELLHAKLNKIQKLFDQIRQMPTQTIKECMKVYEIHAKWEFLANQIKEKYQTSVKIESSIGTAGALGGIGVAAMGPTAAMGFATTFGVASTGTAISALSGAAATNAAIAWLGGGTLAMGGGGMAAGHVFLAFFGPIGWTIAGLSIVSSGILLLTKRHNKDVMNRIYTLIYERDTRTYQLAKIEIEERIVKILAENRILAKAIKDIKSFGTNYQMMTTEQQFKLGTYVNLMLASTELLSTPIMALQPSVNKNDLIYYPLYKDIIASVSDTRNYQSIKYENLFIYLSNLLYNIPLNNSEAKILMHNFKKNIEFLQKMEVDKTYISMEIYKNIQCFLEYRYEHRKHAYDPAG